MNRILVFILLIIGTLFLTTSTILGQTVIKNNKIQFTKKNYYACYSNSLDLIVPILLPQSPLASENVDIRNVVNDSITKILRSILDDQLPLGNYDFFYLNSDCDTTSIDFTNPELIEMHYRVGKNTAESFVSLGLYVDYVAGANGNGFGTDYSAFNLDIKNNKILSIHSLFNSSNTEKLRDYIVKGIESEKIPSPNASFYSEDFNIFGITGDGTGSFTYQGFFVDTNSLILCYIYDLGRGNAINEIEVPLVDIKKFINKEYLWICTTDKKK